MVRLSLVIILFFTHFLLHTVAKNHEQHTIKESVFSVMQITSPAFTSDKTLPKKYTCQGEGVNPPLIFIDVPKNTKSFVLIVKDPNAPSGTFTHWVLFNIPPHTREIAENSYPVGAVQSTTSIGKAGYVAACPPSGTGIHQYIFTLYALDELIVLTPTVSVSDVEGAMNGHVIASANLVGLYPPLQ